MTKTAKKAPSASDKLNAVGIEAICERIANCETMRKIAADIGVSIGSLSVYCSAHPEQYARAKEAMAEKMAEDILEIADESANDTYVDDNGNERTNQEVVARSRLRVDARKWLLSKMMPKKYGDKLEVDQKTELNAKVEVSNRPKLTKEEWMAAHGLGAATRATK